MATVRTRRAYHHGDLRRALLDAALRLAAERSPAGVSLREAARAAGVSAAAPYRHFADKQTMLAAASAEGFRRLGARVDRIRPGAGADRRLLDWTEVYVGFAVDRPADFRMMWGHGSPPKSTTPALQAVARATFQSFFATVSAMAAPWRLRLPARRAVALEIWSIAHGMATLALDGQTLFLGIPRRRVPALARDAVATYIDGLRRRPSSAARPRPAKHARP